ncbi:hypothetical protein J2W24_006670 [Variovorax boronicumulans]|uniref:hypothetical protein n=1 Tax=Variovorax boronicumulans TaxID=436515 RepID=UPI0027897D9C|nr:hypothetical protein [Variovorax boronicumulans]MDP9920983.1 hypothetical protein [Variovorax boronicumulans]
MKMTLVETLWLRLHAALSAFSEKVAMIDPSLISDLGRTKNAAFPLRAYLAFRRSAGSEEVAITVDVQSDAKRTMIESDACKDDGTVLAPGPSTEIQLSEDEQGVQHALDSWVREFEQFLSDSETEIVAAASRLEN